MVLISQPGSDYQLAQLSLDAGHARDIKLMLLDVHAVLDHLYLDGTQPKITAPAEDYLCSLSSEVRHWDGRDLRCLRLTGKVPGSGCQ